MTLEEFVALFGNDIIFAYPYSHSRDSAMKFSKDISEVLDANKNGLDAYFIPNSGGTTKDSISSFNACFIDLDAGKENGKYMLDEEVEKLKLKMMERIKEFIIKPSIIVETRNGYHVYWILKDRNNISLHEWETVQSKLLSHFHAVGSDKSVCKPNQLMRLPFTRWHKQWTGLPAFEVKIVEADNNSYTIEELMTGLKEIPTYRLLSADKPHSFTRKEDNVDLIRKGDTSRLSEAIFNAAKPYRDGVEGIVINLPTIYLDKNSQSNCREVVLLPGRPYISTIREEFYALASRLPLHLFLGLPLNQKFQCIFHNDRTPSAHITVTEDSRYRYKCFGNTCGFGGDIINVVSRIRNCDIADAINFIKAVFSIEYESRWQRENRERLQLYQEYIMSESFEQDYPILFSFIKPHIPKLKGVLEIAQLRVLDRSILENDKMAFTASIRYLSAELTRRGIKGCSDPSTLNKRMLLFTHLGLIDRVPESEIPQGLQEKLADISKFTTGNGNQHKSEFHISLYTIPQFTSNLLEQAQNRVKQFKSLHMKKGAYSRNMSIGAVGKEIADAVFVQNVHKELPRSYLKFYERFRKVADYLLASQGYFTEQQLLNKMQGYNTQMKKRLCRDSIPRLVNELKLKLITVNKATRQQYSIPNKIPSRSVVFIK